MGAEARALCVDPPCLQIDRQVDTHMIKSITFATPLAGGKYLTERISGSMH